MFLVHYTSSLGKSVSFCPYPAIVHSPLQSIEIHCSSPFDLICAGVKKLFEKWGMGHIKALGIDYIPKEGGGACMSSSVIVIAVLLHLRLRRCRWSDQDLVIVQSLC